MNRDNVTRLLPASIDMIKQIFSVLKRVQDQIKELQLKVKKKKRANNGREEILAQLFSISKTLPSSNVSLMLSRIMLSRILRDL